MPRGELKLAPRLRCAKAQQKRPHLEMNTAVSSCFVSGHEQALFLWFSQRRRKAAWLGTQRRENCAASLSLSRRVPSLPTKAIPKQSFHWINLNQMQFHQGREDEQIMTTVHPRVLDR